MSRKKISLDRRKWQVIDGSIYAVDTDEMVSDFSKKLFYVYPAIAFNIGAILAHHIVQLHNNSLIEEENYYETYLLRQMQPSLQSVL
jgi:hypothetical protein